MIDMRKTTIPKSDQLNADDLLGQTLTIKVTKVSLLAEADQPIAIGFEGDGGKPYKPCKSMRRVLVNCWGPDGNAYVGRSMTLYRDDKVAFGGLAVGGIRISHMSHIDGPVTMALTTTRASRKPFTVNPLVVAKETPVDSVANGSAAMRDLLELGNVAADKGSDALRAFWTGLSKSDKALVGGAAQLAAWKAIAEAADAPDVDFDEPSGKGVTPSPRADPPPPTPTRGEGVGGESTPAPDPQQEPLRDPLRAVAADGALSVPPEGTAIPSGTMPSDEARKARGAEIRAEAQAKAEEGTDAHKKYWEDRRKAGEADMLGSVAKSALYEVAKRADAAKGREK